MAVQHILRVAVIYLIIMFVFGSGASVRATRHLSTCPAECRCETNEDEYPLKTMHCTSYDFLHKLSIKDRSFITTLDLSNASLNIVDKRLKHITHLERLNLSYNKISELHNLLLLKKLTHLNLRSNVIVSFSAKYLPDALEYLDVSYNLIKELPLDLQYLRSLKRIDVSGNPFSCHQESLDSRDMLLERNVKIIGRVLCHNPGKFKGKLWTHVVDFDEYFKLHDQDNLLADQAEGSGESEGSGVQPNIESTTVVGTIHDFFFEGSGNVEQTEIPDEGSGSVPPVPFINESEIIVIKHKDVEANHSLFSIEKQKTVEKTTLDSKIGSLEKSSIQKNLGTTIFLVIFLLCLVSLLIYAIKKNRDKKRQARRKAYHARNENKESGIELLPKQAHVINEKQNGNPEAVPLMNGQNGNSAEAAQLANDAENESERPPTHQETPTELRVDSADIGPVQSAPPPTPDITSVKVKASEIPESIPRTPIVVTRSRSSDGTHIVVTPHLSKKP